MVSKELCRGVIAFLPTVFDALDLKGHEIMCGIEAALAKHRRPQGGDTH